MWRKWWKAPRAPCTVHNGMRRKAERVDDGEWGRRLCLGGSCGAGAAQQGPHAHWRSAGRDGGGSSFFPAQRRGAHARPRLWRLQTRPLPGLSPRFQGHAQGQGKGEGAA